MGSFIAIHPLIETKVCPAQLGRHRFDRRSPCLLALNVALAQRSTHSHCPCQSFDSLLFLLVIP
jgi:hypothetical protein